ncbi:UNVERIFIED_CONTAM: hypothetical protein GTU68_038567 [Idotea baltica]|nr:hypothetical protein [Idotea baltica]
MLYDGAILACNSAVPYIKKNDYKTKGEYLYKAIRIIQVGLKMSLNYEVDGEIAINLDALYTYMTNQLVKANIDNAEAPVHEVVRLLADLRGAWVQISKTEAANMAPSKKMASANNLAYMEKV